MDGLTCQWYDSRDSPCWYLDQLHHGRSEFYSTPTIFFLKTDAVAQGWRYQIPELVDLGLRVVAPDLLGFGGSVSLIVRDRYLELAIDAE